MFVCKRDRDIKTKRERKTWRDQERKGEMLRETVRYTENENEREKKKWGHRSEKQSWRKKSLIDIKVKRLITHSHRHS